MEELKVGKIIIGKQIESCENFDRFLEIVNKKKIEVLVVNIGDVIKIDKKVFFEVLWPDKEELISENSLNNNSVVCKLRYNNFSMLFTGDIEEIAEKKILYKYKNTRSLNSNILKVAHHGSNTSSVKEFLDEVKPKISVIGVGLNNKFGHPNDEVINRIEEIGGIVYRTDKMGEITIKVSPKGVIKVNKLIK